MNGEPPDPREILLRAMQAGLLRPDALQTIPGQGIGTQPGPETFGMPGGNALQNIMLAAEEGLTLPPSLFGADFGMPEKVWDPRLLGLLAGTVAVIEPGPGGEAKTVKKGSGKLSDLVNVEEVTLKQGVPLNAEDFYDFLPANSTYDLRGVRVRPDGSRVFIIEDIDDLHFLPEGLFYEGEDVGNKIVGNAVMLKDGKVVAGPSPHVEDILEEAKSTGKISKNITLESDDVETIGYLTDKGKFITAEDAAFFENIENILPNEPIRFDADTGVPFVSSSDLEYPLPWGEWNQGRTIERIAEDIGLDPGGLSHLVVGKTELDKALGEAHPRAVSNFMDRMVDIHNTNPTQSIVESARAAGNRGEAELLRRLLFTPYEKSNELLNVFAPLGNAIYEPGVGIEFAQKYLHPALADAQTSAAIAEILMKMGY